MGRQNKAKMGMVDSRGWESRWTWATRLGVVVFKDGEQTWRQDGTFRQAPLHLLCVPDWGTPYCYSPRWLWVHSEELAKNIMPFPKNPLSNTVLQTDIY